MKSLLYRVNEKQAPARELDLEQLELEQLDEVAGGWPADEQSYNIVGWDD